MILLFCFGALLRNTSFPARIKTKPFKEVAFADLCLKICDYFSALWMKMKAHGEDFCGGSGVAETYTVV